jgi:hypothetical protein
MKNLFAVVLTVLLFSGCSALFSEYFGKTFVHLSETPSQKTTTETFVVVPIAAPPDNMGLKVCRVTTGKRLTTTSYHFRAEIRSTDWTFVDSIVVKIDNETFRLQDSEPKRKSNGKKTKEILTFDISQEMAEMLKNAKSFSVKLCCEREVALDSREMNEVQEFMFYSEVADFSDLDPDPDSLPIKHR